MTENPMPPQTVILVNTRKPPGGGALFLSIIGFFVITAVIGIILGFMARSDAKKNNLGTGRATAAIVIGLLWFVPFILGAVLGESNRDSVTTSTQSSSPAVEINIEPVNPESVAGKTPQESAISALEKRKFKCTGPSGTIDLVQCRKGTVKVPTYGTQPKELLNIELGTGNMSGYVTPSVAKSLSKYGLENLGDDGTGTGVVNVDNG